MEILSSDWTERDHYENKGMGALIIMVDPLQWTGSFYRLAGALPVRAI